MGTVEAGEVSFLGNGLEIHFPECAGTSRKTEDQTGWVLLLPDFNLTQCTIWECWYVASTFLINKV